MVSFRVGGQFSSGAIVLEPQKLNGKIKDGDFFRGYSFLGGFFPGELLLEGNFPWEGGRGSGGFFLRTLCHVFSHFLLQKGFFGGWKIIY